MGRIFIRIAVLRLPRHYNITRAVCSTSVWVSARFLRLAESRNVAGFYVLALHYIAQDDAAWQTLSSAGLLRTVTHSASTARAGPRYSVIVEPIRESEMTETQKQSSQFIESLKRAGILIGNEREVIERLGEARDWHYAFTTLAKQGRAPGQSHESQTSPRRCSR